MPYDEEKELPGNITSNCIFVQFMPCLFCHFLLVCLNIYYSGFEIILYLSSNLVFFNEMFRCPPGHYRAGPTDCILYGDCFWTNQCLNGGTCVRSSVTMNATCVCPPFFEGALCDISTDRTFLIVGNRDFIIIIIIAIMTLLSKFGFFIYFCFL